MSFQFKRMTHTQQHICKRYGAIILFMVSAIFLLSFLPANDFRYFADATRAWRNGTSELYDSHAQQFFYAPWSLIIIAPLSFLSNAYGQAIINLLSLISFCGGVWTLAKPINTKTLALALATPYSAILLLLGQWDGFIVGGIALGWMASKQHRPWLLGLAFVIITTKPTNAVLLLIVLLYTVRRWPFIDYLKMMFLPISVLFISLLACGWNWPLRYVAFLQTMPPAGYNVALWGQTIHVVIPLIISAASLLLLVFVLYRYGIAPKQLALVLVINLLISPFVVPYHFVATAPAHAIVAYDDWRMGLLLWILGAIAFSAFVSRWSLFPLTLYLGSMAILLTIAIIKNQSSALSIH